ncbi:hypothetical protein ACFSKI_01635 [Pseudogracilibacillus auburnensis]|uniref:Uncharacterized protein n=1 Tax=Pseudogracilibacillus auburnensis TaxID=1494959 RepID=A0A2V3VF75_9BACI|nr:hypothetical protein [Pseudogracilibacillus auburnensis]PXW80387.1 hypothetical protein DFR56_1283 [Pseudogracilibacillus auburnensis]
MKKRKSLKPLTSFIILSYIIFFVLFIVIGISMVLGAPKSIINILQITSAWSSDFALAILFKKIFPGLRFKDFVKAQFSPRINFSVFSTVVMIQIIITAVTIFLLSHTNDTQHLAISLTSLGLLLVAKGGAPKPLANFHFVRVGKFTDSRIQQK